MLSRSRVDGHPSVIRVFRRDRSNSHGAHLTNEVSILGEVELHGMEEFSLRFTEGELETRRDSPELTMDPELVSERSSRITSATMSWSSARPVCAIDDSKDYVMVLRFPLDSRYLWQFIAVGRSEFLTTVVDPIVDSLKSIDE